MDFVMRLKGVALIFFALGIGLYIVTQLFVGVAARSGLEPSTAADAASALPRAGLRGPDPAFIVTQASDSVGRIVARRQLKVITRTS